MKSKRRKKITTKKHNLITSTQSNVPNNTKIHQPKVVMQEILKKKNPPKNEKQNFKKEKEREITFCEWENYVQNQKENCKFIVRREE